MILGVIADDFTGATDVASMLVRSGMRTVQTIGVPTGAAPSADAVVVALKSRTVPPHAAVQDSLAALDWLQAGGARQFYFKYCSTFDSTPQGNIGPVTEALLDRLGADFTVACPAFPQNGRTIYAGHLFVGDQLLSDSGMRNHPLTPMTDANLVRVLQAQCRGKVDLVRQDSVARGAASVRRRIAELRAAGVRIAILDAICDDDLIVLADAVSDLPLLTAGSGLALGLAANFRRQGLLAEHVDAATLPAVGGAGAVLSGSCSLATNAQVQHWMRSGRPAFAIDPLALHRGEPVADAALAWAKPRLAREAVLVYATASPDTLRATQRELGAQRAGELVEHCLGTIGADLVAAGVRRLVVAGGETSGAVVQALGIEQLVIGPAIDPGVPWTFAEARGLLLALKSGNFGGEDFFTRALSMTG